MARRPVPSLYELSLLYTKYRIQEYLWNHVKHCPLEPKLIRGPVIHADIENARRCPLFMKAREQLHSRLFTKIFEDLLELFCTFKRRRPSEMFIHAALPLLFTSEMTSLVTKNIHTCLFEWQQIRWHKLRIMPILNLMCAYGSSIVELDILSVYVENPQLFRQSLEAMPKLKYLSFSVIPSHSAHPDYNPEDFIQSTGELSNSLIYLHVKLWKATLSGIQKLIYNDYPNNNVRNNICDTLEYVSIVRFADAVTLDRRTLIIGLLLQNFKTLKIIERDEDCVIPKILCESNMKYESLTRLNCTIHYQQSEVHILSESCPNLTAFQLTATDKDAVLIQNLHLFKKLTVLDVISNSLELDNYLMANGKSMIELRYKGYDKNERPVDFGHIGKYCPNVEKIVLRGINFIFDKTTSPQLLKLKTLFLLYTKYTYHSSFDVNIISWLQTTNIEELYIKTCTNMVFSEQQLYFSFPYLKHLCWENFENFFSANSLRHLVENSPMLETVGSFGTANSRRAFLQGVVTEIFSKNYQVKFLAETKVFNYFVGQVRYNLSHRVLNTNSIFAISYF